ncbi:MAG: hypothetical protein QOK26_625 [Pseudonocardiales bacterium]|nr:hypothetical protein [Pseudonocardiales bacterium]
MTSASTPGTHCPTLARADPPRAAQTLQPLRGLHQVCAGRLCARPFCVRPAGRPRHHPEAPAPPISRGPGTHFEPAATASTNRVVYVRFRSIIERCALTFLEKLDSTVSTFWAPSALIRPSALNIPMLSRTEAT